MNPIVVFDSGLGSLSVVREVAEEMKGEDILYLADRAHFPYGTKDRERLRSIIINTVKYVEKFDPKVIVAASITPSLTVLNHTRINTNIPLFGVYPSLDTAFTLSKKGVAIIATEGTIKSFELEELIKPYIMKINIVKINASNIIELIEEGKFDDVDRKIHGIKSALNGVDVAILGSTHLSLIKEKFERIFPDIKFINPVADTIMQIKTYLKNRKILEDKKERKIKILVSKDREKFESIIKKIWSNDVSIEEIRLPF